MFRKVDLMEGGWRELKGLRVSSRIGYAILEFSIPSYTVHRKGHGIMVVSAVCRAFIVQASARSLRAIRPRIDHEHFESLVGDCHRSHNLIVDSVEESLAFWVDRLGFEKTVEVPHENRIGFAILKRGAVELMLQSRLSLQNDVPQLEKSSYASVLYVDVADLTPIRRSLTGWPKVVAERKTFYGATEIIVHAPGDHVVFFASHA